jgi:hypothetical protein
LQFIFYPLMDIGGLKLHPNQPYGVYILANDKVFEDAIAFLNSLREYSPECPICLIPYNDQHHRITKYLQKKYNCQIFNDPDLLHIIEEISIKLLGYNAPMLRKLACWFGPFERFIYFDLDIVVFQEQEDLFSLLEHTDFISCHDGKYIGINEVFTEKVIERNLFSQEQIDKLFNAGFFCSNWSAFDLLKIEAIFNQAMEVKDIFIPHHQDQTLLNYLILIGIENRIDLREYSTNDAFAGSSFLTVSEDRIYKYGVPARFIHWAGYKEIERRPFRDVWLRYRYPGTISGPVFRNLRKGSWLLYEIIDRVLRVRNPEWYLPGFQFDRIKFLVMKRVKKGKSS